MKTLGRLALFAASVAFGAAIMGSWTRITGDGMSCPAWPACTLNVSTVWEWSHRALVALETPLVLAVLIIGFLSTRRASHVIPRPQDRGTIRTALTLVLALFLLQVALGAATVHLSNSPASVVWHWGTAMAFIATLLAVWVLAQNEGAAGRPHAQPPSLNIALVLTTAAAFATMCIGAYVSSSGAGLACLSLPGCAGQVLAVGSGQFVQMLHRFFAAATLLCGVGAFTISLRLASPRLKWICGAGVALLFGQILLGLLNVALRLPFALREAHAVNAALTFLVFAFAFLSSHVVHRVIARAPQPL